MGKLDRFKNKNCKFPLINDAKELDLIKRIIPLPDFLQGRGFERNRVKTSRHSIAMERGGERLIVRCGDDGVWQWCDLSGAGGTIIDLLQREGLSLGEIRQQLRPFIGSPVSSAYNSSPNALPTPPRGVASGGGGIDQLQHQKKLAKEQKLAKIRQQFLLFKTTTSHPYLLGRGISTETQSNPIFSGRILIDNYWQNAIFPHYNSSGVCGWEIRNNNFKSFATDGEVTVWFSKNIHQSNRLVVTESAIDALSYFQIFGSDGDKTAFISVAGTLTKKHIEIFKKMKEKNDNLMFLTSATDNDKSGNLYAEMLERELTGIFVVERVSPQGKKDWNELLMSH